MLVDNSWYHYAFSGDTFYTVNISENQGTTSYAVNPNFLDV